MHPHQPVNLTRVIRPEIDLPKSCALINPTATLGQFISRLKPREHVVLIMLKSELLRLQALQRPVQNPFLHSHLDLEDVDAVPVRSDVIQQLSRGGAILLLFLQFVEGGGIPLSILCNAGFRRSNLVISFRNVQQLF
jgi:hypothetical protein